MNGRYAWIAMALIFASSLSRATLEGLYRIHQPVVTYDGGIQMETVAFALYCDPHATPGMLVGLALAQNRISTSRGFENRNIASLAGLRMQIVSPGGAKTAPDPSALLFGDTLKVVLEVPAPESSFVGVEPMLSAYRSSLSAIAESARDCMIENAHMESPRIRHLGIKVRGVAGADTLSGVWNLRRDSVTK